MIELAGADAGGPRREYLGNLSQEIFSKLKLFINSPNNKHNVGEEREKWIPNPKANSISDLDNFYKIGIALTICYKLQECLEFNFPLIMWKYFLTGSIEWDDIKGVNLNQVVCLDKIATMTEEDLEYLEETFTTFLGDGQEFELEIGGKQRKLTVANRHEYIEKCKAIHLQCLIKPFEQLRKGFQSSTPSYLLRDNTPEETDKIFTGMNYVYIVYEGGHRSPEKNNSIQQLWWGSFDASLGHLFLEHIERVYSRTVVFIFEIRLGQVKIEPFVWRLS